LPGTVRAINTLQHQRFSGSGSCTMTVVRRVGRLLGLLVCFSTVTAYSEYTTELPNVPSVNGSPWPGVGHVSRDGGGLRNQFGKDFAAGGYVWSEQLCRKDSDGDGFTNGFELGDPNCKWKKGDPRPITSYSTSHPGLAHSVPQLGAAAVPPTPASGLVEADTPGAANSTTSIQVTATSQFNTGACINDGSKTKQPAVRGHTKVSQSNRCHCFPRQRLSYTTERVSCTSTSQGFSAPYPSHSSLTRLPSWQ